MSRSLARELQALRQRTAEAEPSSEQLRAVRRAALERLEQHRRRSWWVLAPALVAAGALVFLLWPSGSWYVVMAGAECVVPSPEDQLVTRAECGATAINLGVDEVELASNSTLVREQDGVRLRRGRATLAVTPRPAAAAPRIVYVSHGRIVVLGTLFEVEQGPDGGRVRLLRGRIVFYWLDGSEPRELAPGEELTWPRREVSSRPIAPQAKALLDEPSTPAAARPTLRRIEPPPNVPDLLARLVQLRSQERHDEAIELLRAASRRPDFSPAQRERFSFELGDALERAGRATGACNHWVKFLRGYPGSHRTREVKDRLKACQR